MKPIYIIDGARTPLLKFKGIPGPFSASELALGAIKPLLLRQNFSASALDAVIAGCVMPAPDEANIARIIALRAGCGEKTPAYSVQRNCASGLEAIDAAIKDIQLGRADLILAGGTESMSHAPLLLTPEMTTWLGGLNRAKSFTKKLKQLFQFKLRFLKPVIALMKGLRDPVCGLMMGQTAEELAYQFKICRKSQDTFAEQSHQRATQGSKENFTSRMSPLFDKKGHVYSEDDGVRKDASVEKLGNLKPFFDKPYGTVTPGNSSQITDGAAFLIFASEAAVKKYQLKPLAKIVDITWQALSPQVMGLGPAHAIAYLLKKQHLTINDIDFWEINEAFSAQVLGCLRALNDDEFCKKTLNLSEKIGLIPPEKLNIYGGAIALGHPVGASGARIVLQLIEVLNKHQGKLGVASLCIGGGQGGAILIEKLAQ